MKKYLLFIILLYGFFAYSQDKISITGKILDKKDGSGLPGVSILVKGTTIGTISDIDGVFKIDVPSNESVLVVDFLGYKKQEITVGNKATFDINLEEDTKQLEEVVVTSLAIKRNKRELGYAIQKVEGKDIIDSRENNIVNGLNSKAAGLIINGSSGSPGSSARIRIRGNTSISANNDPLIVIDGVPMNNSGGENTRSLEGSNGAIDINPNDIESISVLKGPAAAALYGVLASNGALIITTKKGAIGEGKTSVQVTSTWGVDQVNKLPQLQGKYAGGNNGVFSPFETRQTSSGDSRSWGPLYSDLRYDGIPTALDSRGSIIKSDDPSLQTVTPYDNMGKFFQLGLTRDNNIAVTGSSKKTGFYLAIGNNHQQGVVPKQMFERSSFRLNADHQINDKLKISGSFYYANSNASRSRKGGNWSSPIVSLFRSPRDYDITGGNSDPLNNPDAYQFADGTQKKNAVFDNPFFSVNNNMAKDNTDRFIAYIQADYQITPWLSLMSRQSSDMSFTSKSETYSKFSSENHIEESYKGSYYESQSRSRFLNSDIILSADKDFKNTNLGLKVGHNYYSQRSEFLSLQGYNYIIPNFDDFVNTDATKFEPEWSDYRQDRYAFYYDSKIGYKNWLFFNHTGRFDRGSTLPQNINNIYTPSFHSSLVFTDLLKVNSNIYSYGKLKASFATSINLPPAYKTVTYFEPAVTGGLSGQNLYRSQPILGNPNFRNEYYNTWEIGLENKFFKNRFSIDVTYFNSTTRNLILPGSIIPASTGFARAAINSGFINTQGLETEIGVKPIDKKNLSWNISVNYYEALVQSKVTGLENDFQRVGNVAGFTQGFSGAANGYAYGMILGQTRFQRYGQDPNDLTIREDLPIVVDSLGYPVIQSPPGGGFYIIGNPNPNRIIGLRNSITLGNWTLSAFLDIRTGQKMFNLTKLNMLAMGTHKDTETRDEAQVLENSVNKDGTPNTIAIKKDYAYYQKMGGDFGNVPERGIEDASWVRLREITLRYSFPSALLEKYFIKSMSFGFTVRNAFLITPYSGVDPETNAAGNDPSLGRDAYNMPNTRSFVGTLSVMF
jgi:TonB-linked SusC/RagA family outer membrane protein